MKTNFILLALLTVALGSSQAFAQNMNGWEPVSEEATDEETKAVDEDDEDSEDVAEEKDESGSSVLGPDKLGKNFGFFIGGHYHSTAKRGTDPDAKDHGKGIVVGLQSQSGKAQIKAGIELDSESKVLGTVDVSRVGARFRCKDDSRVVCFDVDGSVDARWAPFNDHRGFLAGAVDGSIVLRYKQAKIEATDKDEGKSEIEAGVGVGPRVQGVSTNMVNTNDEIANAATQGFQGFAYIDAEKINAIVGASYGWNLVDNDVEGIGALDGRVAYKFKNGIDLYAGAKLYDIRMTKKTREGSDDVVPVGGRTDQGRWIGGVDAGIAVKFQ